ncbi:LOW QUALITY PROTEIN: major facilitator superfamily domain-containing protein 1-like [Liolophura sinensis]|uniref:LOW QUALITY PROTEIN: major facilitator superfamily domain-containing protein 1-like n=1 Tax=Liolophura sinensis TaxID=3198878 RepID=UPI003158D9D4
MDVESCWFRFVVLLFNCLLTVGSYFCFDMPSVLQAEFQGVPNVTCLNQTNSSGQCCQDCLGLSPANYNLLYAIFSWTNSVIVLFAGYFIDKVGNRVGSLLFSSASLTGACVFAVATHPALRHTAAMFPLLMVGRLLLGSGNGSLRLVQDRVTAFWFKDKELAMAFGITLSFSRLGSVLNFLLTENAAINKGLSWVLLGGAVLCGCGLLAALVLSAVDLYGVKQLGQLETVNIQSKAVRNISCHICRMFFQKLTDVKRFPLVYWLLVLVIVFFYSSVLPFIADSSKFFQDKYGASKTISAYYSGVVYDVSMVMSPVIGILVDRLGYRGWIMLACSALTIPMFPLLAYTDIHPLAVTASMGFTYVIAAISTWPTQALVVPMATVGTAFGITTCAQGLGMGLTNVGVGQILGSDTQ